VPNADPAIIRRATPSDLPALGRLGEVLVATHHEMDPRRFIPAGPRTAGGYAGFLSSQLDLPDVLVVVAERDGQVIGYAYAAIEGWDYMWLRGPAGVLHDLVVDPAMRGGGVGRALLGEVLSVFRERKVPRVVLSTAEQNHVAQRLFAGSGFRRTMVEMTLDRSGPDDDLPDALP